MLFYACQHKLCNVFLPFVMPEKHTWVAPFLQANQILFDIQKNVLIRHECNLIPAIFLRRFHYLPETKTISWSDAHAPLLRYQQKSIRANCCIDKMHKNTNCMSLKCLHFGRKYGICVTLNCRKQSTLKVLYGVKACGSTKKPKKKGKKGI